ncbi:hypothetical protein COU17_01555 [Candidatus Kaiserbacteria bacterium CG10_big_fil_rev_8_21_14_0_10_49_17]|uniref:YtkA-like domain-containing protein n=1 Tax=Candidatus Kaiserbacteria bacterium CG10_big_fil_rev_8_21_14_0_10_49_17 TaxID=1974609 RepID=A0A2M6WER2_9BACT|nr:MAG: hypothetical protein COU17_01555 [Candidatus Kaiserbacteria bacterium CG10_big_fil_rev_8_21_14_0_10_49_17]
MNKYLLYAVAALIVLASGWIVLLGPSTPTVVEIATTSENPITTSVALSPEQPTVGSETLLTFTFTNPDGSPVTDLMVHHGREVHAVLVGENLASIGHIHPQDFPELNSSNTPGVYTVAYTFPEAGRYIVAVDVMNGNGEYNKQYLVDVVGTPKMGVLTENNATTKCFIGYTESGQDRHTHPVRSEESNTACPNEYMVTFETATPDVYASEPVVLHYRVEKDGMPVTDLVPYLDAAIHFAVIPTSFTTLFHRHGAAVENSIMESTSMRMESSETSIGEDTMEDMGTATEHNSMTKMSHSSTPSKFGPNLISEPITFPTKGRYTIFAQFKHGSEIVFSDFQIEVQ